MSANLDKTWDLFMAARDDGLGAAPYATPSRLGRHPARQMRELAHA